MFFSHCQHGHIYNSLSETEWQKVQVCLLTLCFHTSHPPSSSLFSRGTLQAMRFRAARPSSATIFLTLSWLLERWKDACRNNRGYKSPHRSTTHFILEPVVESGRQNGVEQEGTTCVSWVRTHNSMSMKSMEKSNWQEKAGGRSSSLLCAQCASWLTYALSMHQWTSL